MAIRSDSTPHPDLPKGPPAQAGRQPWLQRLLRRPWPPLDVLVLKTSTCPLCDDALEILEAHRKRLGLRIRVHDISDDADLMALYGEEIPVTFIGGRKRFMGRINPVLLKREARRGG